MLIYNQSYGGGIDQPVSILAYENRKAADGLENARRADRRGRDFELEAVSRGSRWSGAAVVSRQFRGSNLKRSAPYLAHQNAGFVAWFGMAQRAQPGPLS